MIISKVLQKQRYVAYGGNLAAIKDKHPEILLYGGAGTGKTRSLLEKARAFALKYKNSRILLMRKTRLSLNISVLPDFENKVIDDLRFTHQAKSSRQEYKFPNGSVIVLSGADQISRIMSSQFDLIFIIEGTEFEYEDYLHLLTRLRNTAADYRQIYVDCNPSFPEHWLLERVHSGKMHQYESKQGDNPTNPPEYTETLKSLTGFLRARLYEGLWVAAEGSIYPQFTIENPPDNLIPTCAGVDFGYRDPCAIVWLAKQNDITWAVDEYQESSHTLSFHMPQFKKYKCQYSCDPSRPDSIVEMQNEGIDALPADNSLDRISKINVAFSSNKLRISPKCEKLISSLKSYHWKKREGAINYIEKPAPSDQDHLCDSLRYAFQDVYANMDGYA